MKKNSLSSLVLRHPYRWVFVASLVVSFFLYANTLSGEFLFDDFQFVHNPLFFRWEFLPHLLFRPGTVWSPVSGYRPLTYMSMNAQLALVGEHPFTFHLVNVIGNALAVFLVFCVTRKLFLSFRLAVITALLFAFFPIHTENVAYIKARDDIFSTVLVLWAWLLLLEKKRWKSAIVFLLAVLTKELVFFAPLLYFLAPRPIEKNPLLLKKRLFFSYPAFLALFTYAGFRFLTFGPYAFSGNAIAQIFNPLGFAKTATKFWTNWKITGMYITKTFFPYNLSAGYQYNHLKLISGPFASWEVWVGITAIALFLLFILHPKTRHSPLGVGALVFGVLFIPLPKILFQGADIFAERWMYPPSIGLAFMGGYEIDRLWRKYPWAAASVFSCILVAYVVVILPRNSIWQNQRAAFTSITRDAPDNMYGWYVLARDYYAKGDLPTAERLADTAYALDPSFPYPELRYLRAQISYHQGKLADAKKHLHEGAQLVSHATQIHGMYALILTKEGDYAGAIGYLEENRAKYDPADPWIRVILGGSYYSLGKTEEAKQYLGWDEKTNDFKARKQLDNFLKGYSEDQKENTSSVISENAL